LLLQGLPQPFSGGDLLTSSDQSLSGCFDLPTP